MNNTLMTRLLLIMMGIGAVIAAMLVASPDSDAEPYNPVCSYLDFHPNAAGVLDVVEIGINRVGLSPEDAGIVVFNIVQESCPWNNSALRDFVNTYAPAVPAPNPSTQIEQKEII